MKRVHLVTLLLIMLSCRITASAQPISAKDIRIFIVKSKDLAPYNEAVNGIQKQLDTDIDSKSVFTGELDNAEFIDLLKTGNPALIVTVGTDATIECRKLFTDVPIVFTMILDPENINVSDNNQTRGNITGVSLSIPVKKQFEIIKDVFPDIKTLGILYDLNTRSERIKELSALAQDANLQIVAEPVKHPKDIPQALNQIVQQADMLWAEVDAMVYTPQTAKQIILKTFRNKMPFFAYSDLYVKAGALMTLACNYEDVGKQTAAIIKQILIDGTPANQIDFQAPQHPQLIINKRTASTIGTQFPYRILKSAYKIYGK